MAEVHDLMTVGIYKDPALTLNSLAGKINQHPVYVSNAVNYCTGKNVKTYINEYRVKESIRILSDGQQDITISELAFQSGFSDYKNFHRIFRKMTNLSPTDFRKNLRSTDLKARE
jgi:AraC-like DNA-binding protein